MSSMENLYGNKNGVDGRSHAESLEGFDATSFFLSDAEDRQLGGRPSLGAAERARGIDSAMAKCVREHACKERLACFKVRVNRGQLLDEVIEGLVKAANITLSTAAEVAPATEAIPVKGIDGEGTGALKYIFFPASQVPQLAAIQGFKEQQSGCHRQGADGLQVTITRDRMMGSRGVTDFALGGLKDSMVKKYKALPVAAAVTSDMLIAEWAAQFDADPDAARFQLFSKNIGQAKGPFGLVQIFDYFVEFAAEANFSADPATMPSQRAQVYKMDWDKLATRVGLEAGDVSKMNREQIYTEHVRDLRAEIASGSNDSDICKRTLVGFNIAPDATSEAVKQALIASAQGVAKSEEEKLRDEDFESLDVRETGAGNFMFKARFKDLAKFEIAYMVEGAKPLQDLHDGKGNQGVRVARDKTIDERRQIYQANSRRVSSWSGPGAGAPKQAWKNDMMSETIDYEVIAEKVSKKLIDKLMVEFAKPQGVFMKAIAGVVGARLQTMMTPLRERLTSIEINIASIAHSVGSDQYLDDEDDEEFEDDDEEMAAQSVLGKRNKERQDQIAETVANEMAGNPAMMSRMLQLVEVAAQNTPANRNKTSRRQPSTINRR